MFGLAARAIDLFVERAGHAWQIGDDEAGVGTLGTGLDAGDHAALDSPAFGGIAEIGPAADLLRFTRDAAEGGVLGERADLTQQHRVAGEAEDVADTLTLAPCHRLGPAIVTVAAHNDLDPRPAGAGLPENLPQYQHPPRPLPH